MIVRIPPEILRRRKEAHAGKPKDDPEKKKRARPVSMRAPAQANKPVQGFARNMRPTDMKCEDIALKILRIAEVLLQVKMYPYQKEYAYRLILDLVRRDGNTLTALFSRQSGKSTSTAGAAAAIAISLPFLAHMYPDHPLLNLFDIMGNYRGFKKGINIGIYAPVQDQAAETLEKIREALSNDTASQLLHEMGVVWTTSNGTTIRLSCPSQGWSSRILCQTGSPTAKIESKTHHLILIEEAQDMDDLVITKSITPMAASHNGTIIYIGTCGFRKCQFLRKIVQNRVRRAETGDNLNFYYPHDVCSKYNQLYAAFVRNQAVELGEDSDAFRVAYKLEWILERGMFVSEHALLKPTVALTEGVFSRIHLTDSAIPPNYSICAGIDFGKVHDSTIVTVAAVDWMNPVIDRVFEREEEVTHYKAFKKHIIAWLELLGDDYDSQFQQIRSFLQNYRRLRRIVADATSVGSPMVDRFCAEFAGTDVEVVPFTFSPSKKSDGYKVFLSDIQAERFTFPYSPIERDPDVGNKSLKRFVRQMLEAEKAYAKNGTMQVSAPDTKDAHDDYCDSGMLVDVAGSAEPQLLMTVPHRSNIRIFK